MRWAFGTHLLLLHGRDDGISDPQTWKVSCMKCNHDAVGAISGIWMRFEDVSDVVHKR